MDRQRVQTHKALGQEKRAKSSVLSPRERESGRESERETRVVCPVLLCYSKRNKKKKNKRKKRTHKTTASDTTKTVVVDELIQS